MGGLNKQRDPNDNRKPPAAWVKANAVYCQRLFEGFRHYNNAHVKLELAVINNDTGHLVTAQEELQKFWGALFKAWGNPASDDEPTLDAVWGMLTKVGELIKAIAAALDEEGDIQDRLWSHVTAPAIEVEKAYLGLRRCHLDNVSESAEAAADDKVLAAS